MDDATRAHLEAMEARLMTRLNDNQEQLLERMRINETAISYQRSQKLPAAQITRSRPLLLFCRRSLAPRPILGAE